MKDIKIINAGNCMICGREIKITTKNENVIARIFFCKECEAKVKAESEDKE